MKYLFFARTCDLKSLVASGHKYIWRPQAMNSLQPQIYMAASGREEALFDFKKVVGFTHNKLCLPNNPHIYSHYTSTLCDS